MGAEPCTQTTIESLRGLLRDSSVLQASQYFGAEAIKLDAAPPNHKLGQVLKTHIVMVLLSSPELRVVLKVHFDLAQVRDYRRAQGRRDEDMSNKQLVDFMKELCNQMGGRVCRIFDAHGMCMGMSVPLCTRGIYEIYADYQTKLGATTKFGDFWGLEGSFNSLYCSCYVETMSPEGLPDLQSTDEQSPEGELDFL